MKIPTLVVLAIATWLGAYGGGAWYAQHQNDKTWSESGIAWFVIQHHQATADSRELFFTCDGRDYVYSASDDKVLPPRLVGERPDVPLLPKLEPAKAFVLAGSLYAWGGIKTLADFESVVWREGKAKPVVVLLASAVSGFFLGRDRHLEVTPGCSRPALASVVGDLSLWRRLHQQHQELTPFVRGPGLRPAGLLVR